MLHYNNTITHCALEDENISQMFQVEHKYKKTNLYKKLLLFIQSVFKVHIVVSYWLDASFDITVFLFSKHEQHEVFLDA